MVEPGYSCSVACMYMYVCLTATFRAAARVRRLLRDSDNKQTDRPRDSRTSSADVAVHGQRSAAAQQRHEHRRQRHRR